jgi:hypothetical protein
MTASPISRQPHAGGEKAADAGARLQESAAPAARMVGPNLGNERGPGHPFRTDPDPYQEAQDRERLPVPRDGAEARGQRVGENGQHHRPLAADIIGDDAADDAARRPAEHRRRQHIPGVARDLGILRRVEQLCSANPTVRNSA